MLLTGGYQHFRGSFCLHLEGALLQPLLSMSKGSPKTIYSIYPISTCQFYVTHTMHTLTFIHYMHSLADIMNSAYQVKGLLSSIIRYTAQHLDGDDWSV